MQKNLNMRQRRWLELIKYYDCEILYHSEESNKVADVLSWKTTATLMSLHEMSKPLQEEILDCGLELIVG